MMVHGHSLLLIVLMEYSVWSPFVNWPNRDLCSILNVLLLIHMAKKEFKIDVSGFVRDELRIAHFFCLRVSKLP